MKLKMSSKIARPQPDPFMCQIEDGWIMYVTGKEGIDAYTSDSPFGEWEYQGIVCKMEGYKEFWAPCMIKIDQWYYLYYSCGRIEDWEQGFDPEYMHVARAKSPLGPFGEAKRLYSHFSIDPHVVQTEEGLFLWYAMDRTDGERIGTRIFVDSLLDPYTPRGRPVEIISPTCDEEIFMKNRFRNGEDWHTVEGAFWLEHDGWQYVMYSGGCYMNDTYHIGYAAAKTGEQDLTKIKFEKHTDNGEFQPLMIKNEWEEGVGHNSVIHYNGEYYVVYHGRDYKKDSSNNLEDRRTARICRLLINEGTMKIEALKDNS